MEIKKKNGSRAIGNPPGGEEKEPLPLYLTPHTHTHTHTQACNASQTYI